MAAAPPHTHTHTHAHTHTHRKWAPGHRRLFIVLVRCLVFTSSELFNLEVLLLGGFVGLYWYVTVNVLIINISVQSDGVRAAWQLLLISRVQPLTSAATTSCWTFKWTKEASDMYGSNQTCDPGEERFCQSLCQWTSCTWRPLFWRHAQSRKLNEEECLEITEMITECKEVVVWTFWLLCVADISWD